MLEPPARKRKRETNEFRWVLEAKEVAQNEGKRTTARLRRKGRRVIEEGEEKKKPGENNSPRGIDKELLRGEGQVFFMKEGRGRVLQEEKRKKKGQVFWSGKRRRLWLRKKGEYQQGKGSGQRAVGYP